MENPGHLIALCIDLSCNEANLEYMREVSRVVKLSVKKLVNLLVTKDSEKYGKTSVMIFTRDNSEKVWKSSLYMDSSLKSP